MNLQLHSPETEAKPAAPAATEAPVAAKAATARPRRAAAKTAPNAVPEPAARAAKPAPVAAPASPVTKAAVKTAAKQGAKVAARPAPLKTAPVAAAPKAARAAASTVVVAKPLAFQLARQFHHPQGRIQRARGPEQRAGQLARHAKKSEILRAGVQLLSGLPDAAFLAALASVPSLKTGRPKQDAGSPAPGGGKKSAR
jgi:hypothetical protein